jgi:uncharacterized membrane protein YoaK (UPF0700 family)
MTASIRKDLTTPQTRAAANRKRALLVVVLALTSGATDAIGFLALGSAFTSVMTGNMVLLGVGAADRDLTLVLSCTVAIMSFVAGAAIGAWVAGNPRTGDCLWPSAVTRALYIQLALFLVFAGCWWAIGSTPNVQWLLPMLGLNAAALGLQSSAIQRFGVSGLSTTYLTGTLTTVVIKLIGGQGLRKVGHSLTILFGLITGAAIGTVLVEFVPVAVPIVQLVTLGAVILAVHLSPSLRIPFEE